MRDPEFLRSVLVNRLRGAGSLLELLPSAPLPELRRRKLRWTGKNGDRLASDWRRVGGDFFRVMRGARGTGRSA